MGGAAAMAFWPLPTLAQQASKSYRIGYLALLPSERTTLAKVFPQLLPRPLGVNRKKSAAGFGHGPAAACLPACGAYACPSGNPVVRQVQHSYSSALVDELRPFFRLVAFRKVT